MAVMAGIDMSMVPPSYSVSPIDLIALVKEGEVPLSRIDEAVRRILRVKFELGLFENPMPNPSHQEQFRTARICSRSSLQAARESMTLLKNSEQHSAARKKQKVLVTGPTSDSLISLNNGWTWTWQGSEQSLYPNDKMTIQQAIEAKSREKEFRIPPGHAYHATGRIRRRRHAGRFRRRGGHKGRG